MIGELAADLVAKIKQIPSFGVSPNQRVGLSVGGTQSDPTISSVTLPAVWVVYTGNQTLDTSDEGQCNPHVRETFVLKILVDNTSESSLVSINMPLLEEIVSVVNAQNSILGAKKWRYEGQSIDEISGQRLVFEQRYSVVTII